MEKHINGTGHIKTKPGKQSAGLFFYVSVNSDLSRDS